MARHPGFPIGTRVVLVGLVERYPLGIWRAGAQGVVTENHADEGKGEAIEIIGAVRLDEHNPALDEWDNALHVYDPEIVDGENGWAAWQPVDGGRA